MTILISEILVREAWLRAEALCECPKSRHGHKGRCNQFLISAARGGTGPGAWEARRRDDPRLPTCEILCAACYAQGDGAAGRGTAPLKSSSR